MIRSAALVLAVILATGCNPPTESASDTEPAFDPNAYDAQIEQEDLPESVEARQFFRGTYYGFPRGAETFVEELYQKGAPKVWVTPDDFDGKQFPTMLIVQLPASPAQRAESFAVLKRFTEKFDLDPVEDEGARYGVVFMQGD